MARVSVVIVAHNERDNIRRCLRSIRSNHDPNVEIIVVDDGSSDGTEAAVRAEADAAVTVIRNTVAQGPAASRNRGLQASRGDYLFFLDADCVVGSDWIRAGREAFSDARVVAVEGAIHYDRPCPAFGDKVPINPFYNQHARGPLTAPCRDFCAGNLAVRRSALLEVGGFNGDRFPAGREDTDLGRRLCEVGESRYEPRMKATHAAESWNLRSLLSNSRRYSADVAFCKDHQTFHFRQGVLLHPQLLAMALFPPLILWRFRPNSLKAWKFVGPFYVYLIALRLVIWRAAARERILLI